MTAAELTVDYWTMEAPGPGLKPHFLVNVVVLVNLTVQAVSVQGQVHPLNEPKPVVEEMNLAAVKTQRSVEHWLAVNGELVQTPAEAHSVVVELFALALVAASVVVVTAQTVGVEACLSLFEPAAAVVRALCSAVLV